MLADWIGSNQDWFPYHEPVDDLRMYWEDARKRASGAVEQAGILSAGMGRRLSYGDLIGTKATASPMQEWASKTDLPSGPALFLIEDETGSGKTEAATMLAHRLMQSGQAAGFVCLSADHGDGECHVRSPSKSLPAALRTRRRTVRGAGPRCSGDARDVS